jgi:hypothetical protein
MNILTNISLEISAGEVMQSLSRGQRDAAWMMAEAETSVEKARKLWQPKIVYAWADVPEVRGESLALLPENRAESLLLHIGPHADLMAKAERAFISVSSIGDELDEQVRELNQKGEILTAFLLDCAGVVALDKVGSAAAELAEKEAAERGWGVGDRLSPGSLQGWPMEGQHELCSLLPLEDAGISLSEQGILRPFKSASGMIGIGPEYSGKKTGSVCRFCLHQNNCWRRRDNRENI